MRYRWWGFLTILLTIPVLGSFSAAETVSPSYRIVAGDILGIHVWKEPELTLDLKVMTDGMITFPLIGTLQAEGETVESLKDMFSRKLTKYVATPQVTVMVKQKAPQFVYTLGSLRKPGAILFAEEMTVLQALASSGGFSEWADTKRIVIIRQAGGQELRIRFNYKEVMSGKNMEQNIGLKPGDTILVP